MVYQFIFAEPRTLFELGHLLSFSCHFQQPVLLLEISYRLVKKFTGIGRNQSTDLNL
jgi:hypothetical protein